MTAGLKEEGQPSIRHFLVMSSDVKFHEMMERTIKERFPKVSVMRAHSGGDLAQVRFLSGNPSSVERVLILDKRHAVRSELWQAVRHASLEGGRILTVAEAPSMPKDLYPVPDRTYDLLSHNMEWGSKVLSSAIVSLLSGGTLGDVLFSTSDRMQGGGSVTSSRLKTSLIEAILGSLERGGVQLTKRARISTVIDELLMNALYDAPAGRDRAARAGESKQPLRVEKRKDTELPEGEHVQVKWSYTGEAFNLMVVDPYGTLEPAVLWQRVVNFFSKNMVEVNRTSGLGGGVGLYMIFRSVASYFARVEQGRMTEVTIKMDLSPSFSDVPKSRRVKREKEIMAYFKASATG